jgi:predicted Zn-dependent protease
MRYRNPRITEPTIRPREGRDFLILLAGVIGLVVTLAVVALVAVEALASYVPFSVERQIAQSLFGNRLVAATPQDKAAEQALQELIQRVTAAMQLPDGMAMTVHYMPGQTVNAMATLGGHVFVFRGLIEKLKSEDALAAVLAHEIGHVRERHVVRAMGRGVAVVGVLGMVGVKSQGLNRWILDKGGELTALSYSREAERDADRAALDAVHALYGHVGGLLEVFNLFKELDGGGAEILRSHPLAQHRRAEVERAAESSGWSTQGALRPLPQALAALSEKDRATTDASGSAPAGEHGSEPR